MTLFLGVVFGTLICGSLFAVMIVWASQRYNPEASLLERVIERGRNRLKSSQPKPQCARIHLGPETAWTSNDGGLILWKCQNCGRFMNSAEADAYFKTRRAMLESMAKALSGARAR